MTRRSGGTNQGHGSTMDGFGPNCLIFSVSLILAEGDELVAWATIADKAVVTPLIEELEP